MITSATRLFALLGRPVGHSLSPRIYNALFAHDGVDAVYVALDVPPERAPGLAGALRTLGVAGVNLTVPHKAVVLSDLDEAAPEVHAAGAANVVLVESGRLVGHNTDGEGFCRAFEERYGAIPGGPALILGAGGAARAVAAALLGRGVPEVVLLSRSLAGGEEAARILRAGVRGGRFTPQALTPEGFLRHASGAGLVINATPAGARALVEALPVDALPKTAAWIDLNYWDPDPPGMAACLARGLRFQGGLDMLVHQAALAYTLFTGRPSDPVIIRRHLG